MCSVAPTDSKQSEAAPSRKTEAFGTALAELLRENPPAETFVRRWLECLAEATEATGCRLRRSAADGTLAVVDSVGSLKSEPAETESEASVEYRRRLLYVYATGRSRIIKAPTAAEALNDAMLGDAAVVIAPLVLDGELRGTIELAVAANFSPDDERGALEATTIACAALADYERRQRTAMLQNRQKLVDKVERFVQSVYQRLDLRRTPYAAANDGRRLIGCDRVTVLIRRGMRYDVVAISGVDAVEHRSEAAKGLGRLAAAVAAAGEAVWFDGSTDPPAPQLCEAINGYVDATHVKQVAVLPLLPAEEGKPEAAKRRPIGALVVEQFEEVAARSGREERARLVALHAAAALKNALDHESVPLLPLWRRLASIRTLFAPGTRAKTIAVCLAIVTLAAALKLIRLDFALTAHGVLQPVERRHVFAPSDGTVRAIHVKHGEHVTAGQLLLELRNTDLDVSLADVTGQRTAAREQLSAVERSLYENDVKLKVEERHRLAGQRSELKQKIVALDEQLRLLHRKREQLQITSPIEGEVTTWNVEQLLRERPVKQGQVLIDVADTAGRWELEIQVPEDGIGLLLTAQEERGANLPVTYRLAAEPQTDRTAEIREVHFAAEVRGDRGNTVLAKAALTGDDLPYLRPGAEAITKTYCSERALGYVWLHDAVDFLRTHVWFRMY